MLIELINNINKEKNKRNNIIENKKENNLIKIIKTKDENNFKKVERKKLKNSINNSHIYKKTNNNIISKLLIINLFLIIIPYSLSTKFDLRKINLVSEITITINGTGDQQILGDTEYVSWQYCIYNNIPDEIHINNEKQNYTGKKVFNLEEEINNITMKFNSDITTSNVMFCGLSNITFINLSKFDSSHLVDMTSMFYYCTSLKSIDFTNFVTSSVTNMNNLFYNCKSLISLDLNYFDTSKVYLMENMFYECASLESLNAKSFTTLLVTTMKNMFANCKSLKSLNLSSFYTPALTNMMYIFDGCRDLISLDISHFNTSLITNMEYLFRGCLNLTTLDLSSFNTLLVQNMNGIFKNCYSLISLNISNFYTPSVNNMEEMFLDCRSLTSLDISNLNTTLVTNMHHMFCRCYKLTSINLEKFITSSVTSMSNMFYQCQSLASINVSSFDTSSVNNMENVFNGLPIRSLDLSNFNTEKVTSFYAMFSYCSTLTTLNLGNFYTPSVTNLRQMFYQCNSLISLNISNFNTSLVNDTDNLFTGCSSLISLDFSSFEPFSFVDNYTNALTSLKTNLRLCFKENNLTDEIKNQLPNYIINCTDDCFINEVNKLIKEKNICIDACEHDDNYRYEYKDICYEKCPNGTHNSIENNFICEDDLICDKYYNYDYTGCLDEVPLGYYLDDSSLKTIDKCYIKCSNCTKESMDNNSCISCNNSLGYYQKIDEDLNSNSFINCYSGELEGYYLDYQENKYKKCFHLCKKCSEYGDENNNKCSECYPNYTLTNSNCNNIFDDIMSNINIIQHINNFINDLMVLDEYSNSSIYYYEITSDNSELKKLYSNLTFIEIPQEKKDYLINCFDLDNKNKIFMLIIDYLFSDLNSVINNYDYKLLLENGTELNISKLNEDFFANIYLPIVNLSLAKFDYCEYFNKQGYDIYDKKGIFYNDVCSSAYLQENDITIDDRKKDIYPNNITLCKENCEYKGVNIEEKRIICECNFNINHNYTEEKDNFLKEEENGNYFSYLLDYINYKIFECYKLLDFEKIKKSYVFYALLTLFFIVILNNIFFYCIGIPNIRKIMNKNFPSEDKVKIDTIKELKKIKIKSKYKDRRNFAKRKTIKTHFNKKKSSTKNNSYSKSSNNILNMSFEENNLNDFTNENINELPFTQAILKDKRNFFQIFISVINQKIELVNLILGKNKIKIILIYQYILSLLIEFFFNTFLYTDDVVSNKYHNNGKLEVIVTLSLSIISNIITSIILTFLNFSKGVEERLEQILEIKNEFSYLYAIQKFIRILKIRVFLYLIIEIILICLSFYYVAIFCIIYNNSQISLLINYFISLLESLILSIIISIVIVITRKIGIIYLNNKLYNVSKYLNDKF